MVYSMHCSLPTLLLKKMLQNIIIRCETAYEFLSICKTGLSTHCILTTVYTALKKQRGKKKTILKNFPFYRVI